MSEFCKDVRRKSADNRLMISVAQYEFAIFVKETVKSVLQQKNKRLREDDVTKNAIKYNNLFCIEFVLYYGSIQKFANLSNATHT